MRLPTAMAGGVWSKAGRSGLLASNPVVAATVCVELVPMLLLASGHCDTRPAQAISARSRTFSHPDCTVGSAGGSHRPGNRSDLLTPAALARQTARGLDLFAEAATTGRESHPAPKAPRV